MTFAIFKKKRTNDFVAPTGPFMWIDENDVLAVAIHEAAHVLAALEIGCDFHPVGDGGYCGGWAYGAPPGTSAETVARVSMVALAADLVFACEPQLILDSWVYGYVRDIYSNDDRYLDDLHADFTSFSDELLQAVAFVICHSHLVLWTAQYLIARWSKQFEEAPSRNELAASFAARIVSVEEGDLQTAAGYLALFSGTIGRLDSLLDERIRRYSRRGKGHA